MADEQQPIRRRSRGTGAEARAGALERLKALRCGHGRRSESGGLGLQIKVADPVYDTVDEDEYETLVAKRRQEGQEFVVDDDGLGYGDQGQEEDWFGPRSSDESEGEEKPKKMKKKKKPDPPPKKPSLSAAAALMGKQRLSSMYTCSISKKIRDEKAKNLSSDSIVDQVIADFAPDEADRARRRRGHFSLPKNSSPINLIASVMSEISAANGADFKDLPKISRDVGKNSESPTINLSKSEIVEENNLDKHAFNNGKELNADSAVELYNASMNESVMVEEGPLNNSELKDEPAKNECYALNAKINKEKKDPEKSATAQWQAVRAAGNGNAIEANPSISCDEKTKLALDSDGSLPFYILDVHEEFNRAHAGNLFLFGKVSVGSTYRSCCVIVKNMQRCIYAIPSVSLLQNDTVKNLEREFEESKISATALRTKLQAVVSRLKSEIAEQLHARKFFNHTLVPVKRSYAFERSDIPLGENYVLKIKYPFKDPPLPSDLKGETFSALLGTHCSALELFLIKRKIKGPSWLSVSNFETCPDDNKRVSWCKYEITIDCSKDVQVSNSSNNIPPVVVTAINLKTVINKKQNISEIVSASVICCHKAKIDTPMLASEWTRPDMLSHFTIVCKPEGGIFPMGFNKETESRNSLVGSNVIISEISERALLSRLITELYKLDPDVLVGHNISGFDLDVLLHRAQARNLDSKIWSKLGRLKRRDMPNLRKGSTSFGPGASPGIMSCIAGRLLCDTYLCSRDLLKEVSYSLTQLAKTQLNKDRREIVPCDILQMFQRSESLMELIEYGETDAWLSMELMFHLSVLPLTRQLANIAGNLWGKTLQGARAQRVEYLLLHSFHAKKFIVPDKFTTYQSKEIKGRKRKINHGTEDNIKLHDLDPDDDTNIENEAPQSDNRKTRKGPAYAGGLVLEPKRGLYDKYILLLDFNSLYPSIIQEYNICFTTVERPLDGSVPRLPSITRTGVLPELLKSLVERRRMVKTWLKTASGLKLQQLDIQQQALKLTANSMYGCLGFSNSRFYAKPLAELITLQGREILQSTVDLVQNHLNLEVIYGDTDSIMIYSGLDDFAKAKAISGKVIQEVNKKYKCLEIDLDGLYKRMLLLKKKKYAAVKLQFNKDGRPYDVIERKGLDMVRRDWSLLSKEVGDYCLSQILSGGSCEDVVESIHNALMKVQEDMRNGQIGLEKYVITKSLTRHPEAYPDAKSQPHVQVALRLKKSGYVTGCSAGDTVPYVICCEQGNHSNTSSGGIAQQARHPDELEKGDENWMVDIDYYLAHQIHPVVSRLCASIKGTSPARLADCLGLDSSKYQSKSSEAVSNFSSSSLWCAVHDNEKYRGCEPLVLTCPSCSGTFDCPTVFSSIFSSISEKSTNSGTGSSTSKFWSNLHCPKCPEEGDLGRISPGSIANQVKRQAEGFISRYYKCLMMCDDETCKYTARSVNLRVVGDFDRGRVCPNYPRCNGCLVPKYTEADLYKQLSYFCHLFDNVRCIDKIKANDRIRVPVENEVARIRPLVELAASTVQKLRDRCAYGWVQLNDLTISI